MGLLRPDLGPAPAVAGSEQSNAAGAAAYAVGAVAGSKTRARRSVTRDQYPTLPAI